MQSRQYGDPIIMRRQWRWIGHFMRREQDNITRTALHWTPEGKRKRGRARNTWRRTVEAELKTMHITPGVHPEAGPEPTDVVILRSHITCHTA